MAVPAELRPTQRTLSKRAYFDALVRHQIELRRYGDTVARDLARQQRRRDIVTVNRLLENGWRGLLALQVVDRARRDADALLAAMLGELREWATAESVYQGALQANALGQVMPRATGTLDDAMTALLPLGRGAASASIAQWRTDWRRRAIREMRNLMLDPAIRGRPASDVLARLVGTPERNFRDGLREPGRRNLAALVNTTINRASNDARLKAMDNIADRILLVAVLDSDTTEICRTLDGRVFSIKTARRPPFHIGCRTQAMPIPAGDDPDSWIPRGRPLSYEDWLRDQDEATQVNVLGKSKAALFAKGKLPISKFYDFRKNRPVRLDELFRRDAAAFRAVADDIDPATRKRLGV